MKHSIILLLLLLPLISFCETKDTLSDGKIKIGISGSSDYCYRILKSDETSKWISDVRDTLEIPKFGYTVSVNILYKIKNNIKIEGAILYSNFGEKTKKYVLNNSNSADLPANSSFLYNYRYLGLPLKINYYFYTKKIKLYATVGLSTNVFLSKKITSVLEYMNLDTKKSNSISKNGFSKINFLVIAGLGINYSISNKFDIKVEPIYKRSINTIIKAPIKEYLYSAGLNLGFYYNL